VITICGSSKFKDQHLAALTRETLKGKIALVSGFFHHTDKVPITEQTKKDLDELHYRKIDMSDEVFIVNVNGYVGESTQGEIAYTIFKGLPLIWLEPESGEEYLEAHTHEIGKLTADFVTQNMRH
jgi:hypothetical protein